MKKGFTLLELMVVIGIIGILSAILLKSASGSSDSARAAKCLANMHNLATACQTVAMNEGRYPLAGSMEVSKISITKSKSGIVEERPGWISWGSLGRYRNSPKSHQASSSWFTSTYNKNLDDRTHALTNGTIWKAISGNASSYRCPVHERFARKKNLEPVWSYVMNSYFGWDESKGAESSYTTDPGRWFSGEKKLDRRLLFAELSFNTDILEEQNLSFKPAIQMVTSSGTELDPTLQYEDPYGEYIGFNHKSGRKWYAHVCFADGHTEKLELPNGESVSQIKKLTEWLCTGTDVGYNGSRYEELK